MPTNNTLAKLVVTVAILFALPALSGCAGRLATEAHEIDNAYRRNLLGDARLQHFNNCMNIAEGWDIPLHMAHNIRGCEDIVESQFDSYRQEYQPDSRWRKVR